MNAAALRDTINRALRSGDMADGLELLRDRGSQRGALMRLRVVGGSVIIKTWRMRSWKEWGKRALGLSNAKREWRVHRAVERAGLHVPRPLEYFTSSDEQAAYEIIVTEDLGAVMNGLSYLKQLLAQRDEAAIRRFENQVLEMTALLIGARIVDVDHQLRNVVVNGSESATRIDFECAKRRWSIPSREYAMMLARLICSHTYACQPDVARSEAFAAKLAERLKPSAAVLALAHDEVCRLLRKQSERQGIDSQLKLAW